LQPSESLTAIAKRRTISLYYHHATTINWRQQRNRLPIGSHYRLIRAKLLLKPLAGCSRIAEIKNYIRTKSRRAARVSCASERQEANEAGIQHELRQ